MSRQPTPVFLQRASYRQRRLRDAAKLMPVLGLILLVLPIAWSSAPSGEPANSDRVVYIFGVWIMLIVLTAIFASRMRADPVDEREDKPTQ